MAKPTSVADSSPDVEASEAPVERPMPAAGALRWADERLGLGKIGKAGLRKVFPDHWSFLLGEIALYSFIILLITGVFLTIWFKPSMAEIEYDGSYQLLKGMPVSEAFASTLHISFDVRGGLLVRQIHHWAALLFVAAAFVHMLRVFFTGAFRKPREVNWLIGVGLMSMSLIAGFAGYSLPDDLLSGTGLRFVDGLIRSIPIIGTWAEFFVFAGEYPGDLVIPRLYMVHILLVPGLLLGLVSAHLALIVYHKHTQYPGPGRTENNVVGYPLFPVYMAKAGGFFFIVFGFLVLMGGLFQINPVWTYGPYDPAKVTAGSQPDWYMGWVEGAIRIVPNWEWHLGPTTWSWAIFLPGVGLMGVLFGLLAAWPFVEAWITGDKREHHIL
ncbi:MAG TPA: cytochrome b N-terminal domain-containing protein, partial [Arachnia sp.]|nr:cytochrome b N-terminal domain-containing protein [Arachnia sp.]